ncbi:unnamed protein product [Trichobilharzia regenti]|nr:unnamed protein product [Trichobilharzia regenti]
MNVFSIYIAVIECVFTLPNTNESAPEIHLISAPVGDRVVLSCGNVNNSHRIYEWLENGRPLEMTGDNLTLHLNGSLDFRLRMENADRIVTCRSYNSFPNGTQDSLLEYSYGFVPIVKAFLAETVHNVTVDWGATYRFPCVFGGTNPRKDIMMLNGAVVTEMEHNITEDSVVECKVQNNLSTVHDVAYIKVRPDSKTWIIKHGTSDRQSHCQLYSSVLPKSSICYPFIENIANEYKDPYLISQSRVYSSELSNQAIENLFNSWDKLFSLSSTSMYLSETNANFSDLLNSSNTKSNMTMSTENLPSASWRCINWAKHLTCAMSYPRCEIHGPDTVSQSFLVNDYIEYPVCAWTTYSNYSELENGLANLLTIQENHPIGTASLSVFSKNSHLDYHFSVQNSHCNITVDGLIHNILQNESSTPQYIRTGWSELISVPEAKNPNLISFSDFAANETSMYSFPMCSSADGYTTSSTSLTKSLCTQLPLEKRFPKSYAEQIQKIDNQQD